MSDAENRNPHPEQGWQPLPQGGEYEQEATAFVQLPEGFTTGAYGAGLPNGYGTSDPLAAPGHGYTPPASFTQHAPSPPVPDAGTDPAATGQWTMPFADPSAGYADPSAGYQAQTSSPGHQDPSAGYQAGAPEAAQPWGGDRVDWPVAGGSQPAGGSGAWSVPAAADDGLEESGEYLVGDDGLAHTGYPAQAGHQGQPGYPGPAGSGGATGYEGGDYPGTYGGADGAADTGEPVAADAAGGTGHWNFTTGLSATTGVHGGAEDGHGTGAREDVHGAAGGPFGAPADDPYARDGGLTGHGGEQGAAPHGGDDLPGGQAYGAGTGGTDPAAGGATGHWSLPADALAQWPPAGEAPQHEGADAQGPGEEAGAGTGMGSAAHVGSGVGADQPGRPDRAEPWTVPAAGGEQPDGTGEFAAGAGAGADAVNGADAHAGAGADAGPDAVAAEGAAPAAEYGEHGESGDSAEFATGAGHHADPSDHAAPAVHAHTTAPGAAREGSPESPDPAPDPVDADADAPADPGLDAYDEHPAASYVLRVNGTDRPVTDAWIGESLLYVLRERLGLAGAKDGCSQGECGACSVQVDGRLVASCLVPAATTAGSEVRTVEGLAQDGTPSDVQRALAASGAVQCGFCVPGMAMTVHDLLEGNHAPSELETRKALCGNLCRCSGYRGVLEAVEEVVKARAEAEAQAGAEGAADTPRIPHQAGPADPTEHAPQAHHPHDPHAHGHYEGPGADPQPGGPA
ncbi:2Fe-2S iron-sulfur cluster binding domain-containing protein [Streptomyces piniterrae]|uniref:2Fe-2S iron-sulfur cluster binding domain-containing protein n=1 Tax=Streptomyces piniterrae TaxID=2571125 RepID=A0A4U0NNR9_9ACTN|nr:2Fe-2S iron-sulfur cluster-binding protein [Streptomyces piniterrae]TJZ56047.1 2Fe-2S iron-sulfur cluster binding domain-containing protein [Streptomyces piniterrae]